MVTITPHDTTAADIAELLREGTPFTCGKMTGYPGAQDHTGQLPTKLLDSYKGARYTVLSYMTPIAWRGRDGKWITPDHKYSSLTSKHQGLVRAALGMVN